MAPHARPLLGLALALSVVVSATRARAMPATPEPQLASQPDGSAFLRVLRGDERDSHMETLDGYSIVRAADGTWVFAELDAHGELAPTDLVVGAVDPGLTGLVPHLQRLARAPEPPRPPAPLLVAPDQPAAGLRAASFGTARHLVILAAFADQWDYSKQTVDARYGFAPDRYAALMNEPGHSADGAAGSLADYFDEATNGQLHIDSVVTAWVRLPDVQARYANSDGRGTDDGGRLARDALVALQAAGFDFGSVDGDGDGWVDMLTVVHSGWDAAAGNGQQDYVWSHASSIDAVTFDGVRAARYTTISALRDLDGTQLIARIGVACHELGHFLGVRDYYDTDGAAFGDGSGLGNWSLMAGGGWNGGGARPGPFDAYTRALLGWVAPQRIHSLPSATGLVFLVPRSATTRDGVFRIDDGFADGEYLLVEHYGEVGRFHRFPYDEALGEGVAIWHIDERRPNNDHSATPTLLRARMIEADGDQSLTTSGNVRSESEDIWAPSGGAALTL
ncbi:MAG: M6 family metalloprotease domain-containing protein, partial [Myxococcota bacterium]